jgi:hypothetical protein
VFVGLATSHANNAAEKIAAASDRRPMYAQRTMRRESSISTAEGSVRRRNEERGPRKRQTERGTRS